MFNLSDWIGIEGGEIVFREKVRNASAIEFFCFSQYFLSNLSTNCQNSKEIRWEVKSKKENILKEETINKIGELEKNYSSEIGKSLGLGDSYNSKDKYKIHFTYHSLVFKLLSGFEFKYNGKKVTQAEYCEFFGLKRKATLSEYLSGNKYKMTQQLTNNYYQLGLEIFQ